MAPMTLIVENVVCQFCHCVQSYSQEWTVNMAIAQLDLAQLKKVVTHNLIVKSGLLIWQLPNWTWHS